MASRSELTVFTRDGAPQWIKLERDGKVYVRSVASASRMQSRMFLDGLRFALCYVLEDDYSCREEQV